MYMEMCDDDRQTYASFFLFFIAGVLGLRNLLNSHTGSYQSNEKVTKVDKYITLVGTYIASYVSANCKKMADH